MKYTKFSILTTTEAEDFISAMLYDLGVMGVEIENNVPLTKEELAGMFVDFPPELAPDDGSSVISFYAADGIDTRALLQQIYDGIEEQRQFVNVGPGTVKIGETEDTDWLNNWKQYFHAFLIDDIYIRPTWEEPDPAVSCKTEIVIDPGISFGTGKHETTQLCIKALRKYLKEGALVLDAGFGSGILSIVSLKLGASKVVGTDIDEACLTSVKENFAVNGLPAKQGIFYCGNLIDDKKLQDNVGTGCFDIVVANILADVIIPMAPVIPDRMKPDGIFIASGIIDFKEKEVKEALSDAGFTILETMHQGEWVGIVCNRSL